jgi:hypothetical protein
VSHRVSRADVALSMDQRGFSALEERLSPASAHAATRSELPSGV